ncbi:hypothetical protein MNBD_GAMMA21-1149 [hydrothermal vent metagenome]|uniref:Uncharacterized protein n=1 Tax=hydrothermal vent metagenome TaxID=652676 RepID=A0A3B0ZY96_9ZZZZ
MSLAPHIEINDHNQLTNPAIAPITRIYPVARSRQSNNTSGQVRPVNISLTELMFTGRVPVSTWTFAFAIHNKLWISDLTTLYFGKRVGLNKLIFSGKLFVPDNRLDMEMGITAFNGYGDILDSSEQIRAFMLNEKNTTSKLIRLDQNCTQLLFKIDIEIRK